LSVRHASALLVAVLGLTACPHPVPRPVVPAAANLVEAPAWRTMSAEHRVTVAVRRDDGRTDTRRLRGLIAIERPGRLRLRALGPAGITLFDLLVRDGQPKVISAIRGPSDGAAGQTLDQVIASLAADLACAYALDPRPAERRVRAEGEAVLVEEAGRRVRLSQFSGAPAVWHHAEIESARYRVTIEVDRAEADAALDPALFTE